MRFGQVGVQPGHLRPEGLRRLGCCGNHDRMHASTTLVRAYPNPAQSWILKPRFGVPSARVNPIQRGPVVDVVEGCKCLMSR